MTYRFAGRLAQDGKLQIFVSKGDIPLVAKVGDNLDGYVVESITANSIVLLYPPLGHRENIVIPIVGSGESATLPVQAPQVPARTSAGK